MKSWALHHSWTVQNGQCHIVRAQNLAVKTEVPMQTRKSNRLQDSCGEGRDIGGQLTERSHGQHQ